MLSSVDEESKTLNTDTSSEPDMTELFSNSPKKQRSRRCRLLRALFAPMTSVWSSVHEVWQEVIEKKHELTEVREEDALRSDKQLQISYNVGTQIPGFRFIEPFVLVWLWVLTTCMHLSTAFRTGNLAWIKKQLIWWGLILVIVLLVRRNVAVAETQAQLIERERRTCHTGIDTTRLAQPPCLKLTETDFTMCNASLADLQLIMDRHVQKDKHTCIASFHVGGRACAISVQGMLRSFTYFNPMIERIPTPIQTVTTEEPSDYFSGITLRRRRPVAVTLAYTVYDKKLQNLTVHHEQFRDEIAACILHSLEVLDGTHHQLYLKAKNKEIDVSAIL